MPQGRTVYCGAKKSPEMFTAIAHRGVDQGNESFVVPFPGAGKMTRTAIAQDSESRAPS
jgi:hypothetical protein